MIPTAGGFTEKFKKFRNNSIWLSIEGALFSIVFIFIVSFAIFSEFYEANILLVLSVYGVAFLLKFLILWLFTARRVFTVKMTSIIFVFFVLVIESLLSYKLFVQKSQDTQKIMEMKNIDSEIKTTKEKLNSIRTSDEETINELLNENFIKTNVTCSKKIGEVQPDGKFVITNPVKFNEIKANIENVKKNLPKIPSGFEKNAQIISKDVLTNPRLHKCYKESLTESLISRLNSPREEYNENLKKLADLTKEKNKLDSTLASDRYADVWSERLSFVTEYGFLLCIIMTIYVIFENIVMIHKLGELIKKTKIFNDNDIITTEKIRDKRVIIPGLDHYFIIQGDSELDDYLLFPYYTDYKIKRNKGTFYRLPTQAVNYLHQEYPNIIDINSNYYIIDNDWLSDKLLIDIKSIQDLR